jgi:hypothetical protein
MFIIKMASGRKGNDIMNVMLKIFKGEGVGTSMIRMSTGKKFQNVKMVFLVDQNVEIRTSKMSFELIRTPTIRTSKIALKIKN